MDFQRQKSMEKHWNCPNGRCGILTFSHFSMKLNLLMERETAWLCCSWIIARLFSSTSLLPFLFISLVPEPLLLVEQQSSHYALTVLWSQRGGMCGFGFPFTSKAIRKTSVWVGGVSALSGQFLQIAGIHLSSALRSLFPNRFSAFLLDK